MEKTEQYTFGADEKDILLILSTFEKELTENLDKEDKSIEKIKYYKEFDINQINFKNIFITTEKDDKGNITYHVYCGNSSNELLSIEKDGKVDIKNAELEKYLGEIDFDKIIEENEVEPERLKGISEKAEPKDMVDAIKEEKKEEQDEETQKIEEDLQEQGEDLKIVKYRKIKDNHIDERMPEVFENGVENGIAFSNKLNKYVIITKENGHYRVNENVEPGRMTWETIISIDSNGQKVERKVPYALMELPNNDEKEIAVILDQYGDASIETVDVLPCQERISRAVRHEREGQEAEESYEIRNEFKTEGEEYKHNIAHQVENIEKDQKAENKTVDYDITEDDYIPNTKITWGELMEETGDSLPKLIERYNKEISKQGADSEKAVQTIEDDYGNVTHQRTRN